MTIQSLAQMLDKVEHMVHDQINAIGKVPAIVIAQKGDGKIIMIPYQPRPTAIQRRIHALALGNHFREWGVVSYVVAHEVWATEHSYDDPAPLTPPSKSADRFEGVMVQAHNIMESQIHLFRIDRPDGKPKLTLIHKKDANLQPGGTWDNLLMDPNSVQ